MPEPQYAEIAEYDAAFAAACDAAVLLKGDCDRIQSRLTGEQARRSLRGLAAAYDWATELCRRRLADPPKRHEGPTLDEWGGLLRAGIAEGLIGPADVDRATARLDKAQSAYDVSATIQDLRRLIDQRRRQRDRPARDSPETPET